MTILDADFAIWLADTSKKREVLAKLSFTGYDSGGSPFTKTVKLYVSKRGYTSHATDTPANKHFDAYIKTVPTISRQMGADFAGPVSITFGDLVLSNPRRVARGPGILDDYLRLHPIRSTVTVLIGDPSWELADFRVVLEGRLGDPVAISENEIKFELRDLSDLLDADVQTSLFTSGDYINQRKPILFGQFGGGGSHGGGQIEPPLTDSANLIYTISDAAILPFDPSATTPSVKVYDKQVELKTAALTCSAVAGNVISFSANHGMVVNYLWRSPVGGALPTPLTNDTNYWVQSVPAANQMTLSANRGGAVITLTSATLVANTSRGYGYTVTHTGPATIQLATGDPKLLRITVSDVVIGSYSPAFGVPTPLLVAQDVVTRAGLSGGSLGPAGLGLAYDMGYWMGTAKRSARDVLNDLCAGCFAWYTFTNAGLFIFDELLLPQSTSVKDFIEEDVRKSGNKSTLKQISRIRAKDMTKAEIRINPWFLSGGPFQGGTQAAMQGYSVLANVGYGAASTPIDNYPPSTDSDGRYQATFYYTKTAPGYKAFFKLPLGIFEFQTGLGALYHATGALKIGDTISLTHSRLGFKNFSAGTVSPDNASAFDGTKLVVCGITSDLLNSVTLRAFKQIPGYYPTADLN